MSWFQFGRRDEHETERLRRDVERLLSRSHIQTYEDAQEFVTDLLVEVCAESDLCPSSLLAERLVEISLNLLIDEPFCIDVEKLPQMPESLADGVVLRHYYRRAKKVLQREEHYLNEWRKALKEIWLALIVEMPVNVLIDPRPDGTVERPPILSPTAPLYEFMEDYPQLLDRLMRTFFDKEFAESGLFFDEARAFEGNLCAASGVPWDERNTSERNPVMPSDNKHADGAALTEIYLKHTKFLTLFTLPVPMPVPRQVRFEHTHIIGGTGHGKTQLLQYLIHDDLAMALEEKLSVVVVDPDGTLIENLTHLQLFEPNLLGDQVIFIDPTDSEQPVGLNLFDVPLVEGDVRARETVENNTIELFEYFFDALLGSELTSRQSTLFRYLGLLLMQIPGGNIHTLRELMEDGEKHRPFMEQLTGTARMFFETRFFDPSLRATKQQILARLWGVLSNRSLDRLFSAKRNTVQLDQAMQDGKLIFVNSSKEYLGEEGSHIFARMIVALLGQGLIRRAALAPENRTPTFIYLDEAEGVVDQTLIRLLAQVRKYRGAITLAHQHLDQLNTTARNGVLANTSIKLAGGVSAQDATKLAPELRVDKDFILGRQKTPSESQFALFAKNVTPQAMNFAVPLGYVEGRPRLSAAAHQALVTSTRERYGWRPEIEQTPLQPPDEPPSTEEATTLPDDPSPSGPTPAAAMLVPVEQSGELDDEALPPAPVIKEGGGGARHREIQQLIKELGEAGGYRANVEEMILDGEGRVDVILRRDNEMVCCEVSVTTTKEHELINVQKCFRFGADTVWLIANTERHRKGLDRYVRAALSEAENERLAILDVDGLPDLLPGKDGSEEGEKIVRGYRVRSKAPSKQFLRKRIADAFHDPTQG